MKVLDIPKSGRFWDRVFYTIGGRVYARRYVVPARRRTGATGRARGSLGAMAKLWRDLLTEGQRLNWIAAGAKVQSRPRLEQSGPLTGLQHFAGINSARECIGREVLLEPPERVVFGPNPVEGLRIRWENGRVRMALRVCRQAGPAEGEVRARDDARPPVEDIMVFGAAPCSAGRKKWRHGAYLGLLPAPVGGESDITEMYVARYGEPEAGKRVFIRTRQQRNGWEGHSKDSSEVVRGKPVVEAGQIRRPKAEIRRKSESRNPNAAWSGGLLRSPGRLVYKGCTREQRRSSAGAVRGQCRRGKGCPRRVWKVRPLWRLRGLAEARRSGHWRELWHGS